MTSDDFSWVNDFPLMISDGFLDLVPSDDCLDDRAVSDLDFIPYMASAPTVLM